MKKKIKAFTIIEIILSLAMISVLVSTAYVTFAGFLNSKYLSTNADQIVQCLRKAQFNSMMRIHDSEWGVNFADTANNFTFFKGSSYSGRDANYDESYDLPSSLQLDSISINGGGNEVVFAKITGETDDNGSLVIKQNENNFFTISINTFGQVEIND